MFASLDLLGPVWMGPSSTAKHNEYYGDFARCYVSGSFIESLESVCSKPGTF